MFLIYLNKLAHAKKISTAVENGCPSNKTN